MLDLHTHILPGIDDGAADISVALDMAAALAAGGVEIAAATPHFDARPDWEALQQAVVDLQTKVDQKGIPLQLVSGAELYIDPQTAMLPSIPTYGNQGRYVLVEFPMREIPGYARDAVFKLQVRGLTPIIAHPERYADVLHDPNCLREWIDLGCLIQINSGSLLGLFGSRVKETAGILVTHDMVHLMASDGHSTGNRGMTMREGADALRAIVSTEVIRELTETTPKRILEGEPVSLKTPKLYKPKRRFLFFGKRRAGR